MTTPSQPKALLNVDGIPYDTLKFIFDWRTTHSHLEDRRHPERRVDFDLTLIGATYNGGIMGATGYPLLRVGAKYDWEADGVEHSGDDQSGRRGERILVTTGKVHPSIWALVPLVESRNRYSLDPAKHGTRLSLTGRCGKHDPVETVLDYKLESDTRCYTVIPGALVRCPGCGPKGAWFHSTRHARFLTDQNDQDHKRLYPIVTDVVRATMTDLVQPYQAARGIKPAPSTPRPRTYGIIDTENLHRVTEGTA